MSMESILSALKGKIGEEEPPGQWMDVGQERINQFADATGDHQWIHIDVERARSESPYKDTIAHGFLTLSLIPALAKEGGSDSTTYEGVKLAVNYGLNRVRFPAPVKVNSRVRSRAKLVSVDEVGGGLQLVKEITVEVDGQDKPCCVAEAISRLYF